MSLQDRAFIVAAILAFASVAFVWWRRRQGVVRLQVEGGAMLSSERLGVKRGYRATLVQFSSEVCAKCPPTATLLRRVADDYKGVVHVEISSEHRMDLTREFDIMRTPTVLVLNHEGRVVARMSGAPTEVQAREAIDAAPSPTSDYTI